MTATTRWPLRNSESFELDSRAVGDRFAIGTWQPDPAFLAARGLKADGPLQLVYVLDGGWCLAAAAAIALLQLVDLVKPGFPPLLLVGIDYPEGRLGSRSRDYTMADAVPDDPMVDAMKANPLTAPGGADRFLAFIETELDPLIRSRHSVQGPTAGLIGDSFGGTFAFYAMLKQSRLFDRYWLGSPGLFTTGTDYLAQADTLLSGPLVHDTRMFLSVGELEAAGGVALYEDMGRNFARLVGTLDRRAHPQLTYRAKTYPGHTHSTIVLPALNDALLYLYGPHFPG
jgi:predicted alpha/beta superfamily hydrolase